MSEFVKNVCTLIENKKGQIIGVGDDLTQEEIKELLNQGYEWKNVANSLDMLKEKSETSMNIVAVVWLEAGKSIENIELWIECISEILKKFQAKFIYEEVNIRQQGIASKLFLDNSNDVWLSGICQEKIERLFRKKGIYLLKSYDLIGQINQKSFEKSGTLVNEYLDWLEDTVCLNKNISKFRRVYVYSDELMQSENNEGTPFLSIITRTQGKRPEALRETLLGLAAQTDDDFEVLIMGHKLNDEQTKLVEQIIDETEENLKSRIRLIRVEGGNRTTPINEGFSNARGIYASILDDDDIIFDNWVEEFKRKAQECPGAVLHAYTIAQDWMTINTQEGIEALRACGSPQKTYCKKFNWLSQMYANICPPVGIAFPVYPFKEWGIKFDETLDTTEDWDYLMRVGFLCGVADIEIPTCIYRLWVNAENSQTVHSKSLWLENHKKIQKKFEKVPLIMPKGYSNKISIFIQSKGSVVDGEEKNGILQGEECPLYIDFGNGFSEKNVVHECGMCKENVFEYIYTLPEEKVFGLRWDPTENKDKMLDKLEVVLVTTNGKEECVKFSDIRTNGIKLGQRICFLKKDPQIYFKTNKMLHYSKVILRGEIYGEVPEEIIDRILGNKLKVRVKNNLKKIYHMVRK